jgi:hypothetical protein
MGPHGCHQTCDGLLAAIALANGLTLAIRNDFDVAGLGMMVFNPLKYALRNHRS